MHCHKPENRAFFSEIMKLFRNLWISKDSDAKKLDALQQYITWFKLSKPKKSTAGRGSISAKTSRKVSEVLNTGLLLEVEYLHSLVDMILLPPLEFPVLSAKNNRGKRLQNQDDSRVNQASFKR